MGYSEAKCQDINRTAVDYHATERKVEMGNVPKPFMEK